MRRLPRSANVALLLAALCLPANAQESAAVKRANPLLTDWQTPYGVPPFDLIQSEDYQPAFEATMEEHLSEIEAIKAQKDKPSFANTIEALERSGENLRRVADVFFAVNGANTNDVMRETARVVSPLLAQHADAITLDPGLFERVKAVHDQRKKLKLSTEEAKLLEETHKRFVRSGANLPEAKQARLREINTEMATLTQQFNDNLLNETNDFDLHVTDEADLGSLPQSLVAAAAAEAKRREHASGWSFTLQRQSYEPFLQYSPNRELRRQIFEGYAARGNRGNEHDNNAIVARLANLRVERAQLMGYPNHAAFVLSDNMAETPKRVYELLDRVWKPTQHVAAAEREAFAAMMHEEGIEGELQAWDWAYYAEKVRRARYDLDEEMTRPYFEFTAVREGAFAVAEKLFGLKFRELSDLPRWHPEQQVFEVTEADGKHLGILYMDFFARESKRAGAWMNELRPQSRRDGFVNPVITNNFNFPTPTAETKSLLSFSEAQTLFHEFGHGLHGLLSDVHYASLSGTNVPRDFVEFPSQVMENWMSEPEVLRLFARHYETGELIPDALIEKMQAAAKFNQGFTTAEYMAASYLDMGWHVLEKIEDRNPAAFEKAEMDRIGLIPQIIPRYRNTYFAHIFAGGYSAGYYSYLWSEVLDADAFEAFKETSLFDAATAKKYRKLLASGGTAQGMDLYREFRGRDPKIEPLLERRGLSEKRS